MIAFFTGTTHRQLGAEIAALLHVPALTIHREIFSDGETYIRLPPMQKKDVVVLQSGAPQPNDALIDLLFMLDAVFRGKPRSVSVVLPFLPYRRQERQDRAGEAVGAAVVARCLSLFPVKRFFYVQPHTAVLQSFFSRPCTALLTLPLFVRHFQFLRGNSEWVVVAPDEGGVALSTAFARALRLRCVLMRKKRDAHDHVAAVALRQGRIAQKNAIIIDDEINTGGTIMANVSILRKHGVRNIVVAATHAVFSGDAVRRLQHSAIDRVVVTNSIHLPLSKKFRKLERISLAPLIADALALL